jgi:hypothetical protein
MKLSIKERLEMPALFPRESSYAEQLIFKIIADKILLTDEEQKAINITPLPNGGIQWDAEKAKPLDKDIPLADVEIGMLKSQVDRLDRERKITLGILELCKKIKE